MTEDQKRADDFQDRHGGDGVVFGTYQSGRAVLSYGQMAPVEDVIGSESSFFVEFPDYANLTVRGPDSARFLHGLLTQDIQELGPKTATRSSLVRRDGRLIAVADVWRMDSSTFRILLPPSHVDAVINQFERHRVCDRVSWDQAEGDYSTFLFFPSKSGLPSFFVTAEDTVSTSACGGVDVQHGPGWPLMRTNRLVQVEMEALGGWMGFCETQGVQRLGAWELEQLRIRSGWPLCGVDAIPEFMPLDVGLDQTVSFLKGCFLGSDVLNWVAERGAPNYRWSQIELAKVPTGPEAQALYLGDELVGSVTSWTRTHVDGRLWALGVIQGDRYDLAAKAELHVGSDRVLCRVLEPRS